jgi:myo-inositol 2-dehydrogenase/D-chiro-inositol 1-dehydrogenase
MPMLTRSADAQTPINMLFKTRPFQSLDEAIHHGPLDAVIISSPTFTHEAVIIQAASHGLDVFTEKPVDETADKITALFEIAARGGISLCCGFQRRFDASYMAAANAVRAGKIGTPVMANIFFADHPCPPKEFLLKGGNVFMDLSAHDVDYIMHVLEDDVVSVYATGTSSTDELADAGVHDNASVLMKFSRGPCSYETIYNLHILVSLADTFYFSVRHRRKLVHEPLCYIWV